MLVIAGHRIGTAELESALTSHPAVCEAAVVGVPDKIKGEVARGFVILNDNVKGDGELARELREHVRSELGPVAVLRQIEFRADLPRTRSGKLVRRILKAQTLGHDVGDTSTLEE